MTRPIEQNRDQWCSTKEAAALAGRDYRTVQRWVAFGLVRTFREPGGRVLIYKPDFMPPERLPERQVS